MFFLGPLNRISFCIFLQIGYEYFSKAEINVSSCKKRMLRLIGADEWLEEVIKSCKTSALLSHTVRYALSFRSMHTFAPFDMNMRIERCETINLSSCITICLFLSIRCIHLNIVNEVSFKLHILLEYTEKQIFCTSLVFYYRKMLLKQELLLILRKFNRGYALLVKGFSYH